MLELHEDALARGEAVASEILNTGWRTGLGHMQVPEITARAAGENLARISGTADLTLYAHYTTDAAGHRREMSAAVAALERVDAFLGGLLDALAPETLLLIASDHGNLEDVEAGHTRNPVLGVAVGPGAEDAATMTDILEVTPFVLRTLRQGASPATADERPM